MPEHDLIKKQKQSDDGNFKPHNSKIISLRQTDFPEQFLKARVAAQ
jgi:hypothetical protein